VGRKQLLIALGMALGLAVCLTVLASLTFLAIAEAQDKIRIARDQVRPARALAQ